MTGVLFKLLGIDITLVTSDQRHELGIEIDCDDGTRRKYVRAGAAVAQYDALIVDVAEGHYDLTPASAANQPIAGVAPYAMTDNYYGWVIVRGKATCKVAATVVAGAPLVTTATAGTLDDTAGTADNALAAASGIGVILVADDTPSAGLGTVILS